MLVEQMMMNVWMVLMTAIWTQHVPILRDLTRVLVWTVFRETGLCVKVSFDFWHVNKTSVAVVNIWQNEQQESFVQTTFFKTWDKQDKKGIVEKLHTISTHQPVTLLVAKRFTPNFVRLHQWQIVWGMMTRPGSLKTKSRNVSLLRGRNISWLFLSCFVVGMFWIKFFPLSNLQRTLQMV